MVNEPRGGKSEGPPVVGRILCGNESRAELRRTEFSFSGEPVNHVVNSMPGKIEFCTSELDLCVGSKFLGRDLDPPTAYNLLASESLRTLTRKASSRITKIPNAGWPGLPTPPWELTEILERRRETFGRAGGSVRRPATAPVSDIQVLDLFRVSCFGFRIWSPRTTRTFWER